MPSKVAKKNVKQAGKVKQTVVPPKKPVTKDSDSDSEEESSDEDQVVVPVTKGVKKQPVPAKDVDSEDDDDDEDLDSEDIDDSDDEDEDDDDDEQTVPPATKKGKVSAVSMEEDDDDDDEDDDDDDDEDDDEDEEDDDDDDEDGSEDDEDSDEEPQATAGKKRKLTDGAKAPAKKAKTEPSTGTGKRLFVKGFPPKTDDEQIKKFFTKNGISVATIICKDGKKPFWFVDLANASQADAAAKLNGQEFGGSTLTIQIAKDSPKTDAKPTEKKPTEKKQKPEKKDEPKKASTGGEEKKTLFVGNLSWNASEEDVKEHFDGCASVRLPKRPDGKPRGIAFIEYATEQEAAAAIEAYNDSDLDGRKLNVSLAGAKGEGPTKSDKPSGGPTKTLFVKNLSYDTTSEDLKQAFQGAVDARLLIDHDTGRSKGLAFVEFESVEAAKTALEESDGLEVDGRNVKLDFAAERGQGGRGGGGGGRGGRGGFRGGRGGGNFRGGRGGGDRGGRGRGGFGGRGRGRGGRGRSDD